MLVNDKLSQKEIVSRLNKTKQSISKVVKKLRDKGFIKSYHQGNKFQRGMVIHPAVDCKKNLWRFHSLHFIVTPYYFYPRYYRIMKERGNYGIPHRNYTLMLYTDRLRIQTREGVSYSHEDKYMAVKMGEDDFNRFLHYIAHRYGFEYQKDGRIAVNMVNSHLACNPGMAEAADECIQVRGYDGKVWFVIDRSDGFEHEYIGKESFVNSENLEPYLNDLAMNTPPTNSQLSMRILDILNVVKELEKKMK